MVHSASSFLDTCERQGLKPRRGVEDISMGGIFHPVDPTRLFNVYMSARMNLEDNPSKPLARPNLRGALSRHRKLDLESFRGDVLATALGRMINNSVQGEPQASSTYEFKTPHPGGGVSCNKVEPNFMSVIDGLASGATTPCEAYLDDAGNPVFLRKGSPAGHIVALSLAEISINGHGYAPLSVMRLTANSDPRHGERMDRLPSDGLAVRSLADIALLSNARPSAFGMSQEEVQARFPNLDASRMATYDYDMIMGTVQEALSN